MIFYEGIMKYLNLRERSRRAPSYNNRDLGLVTLLTSYSRVPWYDVIDDVFSWFVVG